MGGLLRTYGCNPFNLDRRTCEETVTRDPQTMRVFPFIALLASFVTVPGPVSGRDTDQNPTAPWQDAVWLLYDDAYREFSRGVKAQVGDPREWRFGQAITLLNLQPRTDANVTRAETTLRELADAGEDDEICILSRYYLGRIAQVHRMKPNPDEALSIYQALLDDHPEHLFAQYGAVKWSITYLGTASTPELRLKRLVEIERQADRLTLPGPAKDLHLFIADACMRYNAGDERALEHLVAASNLGIRKRNLRGDTWVRIGELARRLGRNELALESYGRFVEVFPRDLRTYTIVRTMAEMEADR